LTKDKIVKIVLVDPEIIVLKSASVLPLSYNKIRLLNDAFYSLFAT